VGGVEKRNHITKEQAQAFRQRWDLVNAAEKVELRTTPAEVKFRQLAALIALARDMGWNGASETADTSGREIWRRLRQAYGV